MSHEGSAILALPAHCECLYNLEQLHAALDTMALEINQQMAGSDPVLVLTVMNGGLVTAGQLLPRLDFLLEVDYVHASRYGNRIEGGKLQWQHEPNVALEGRRVLFLDDILDRGITLQALVDYAREKGAASVHTAALIQKRLPEPPAVAADFLGLTVPDRFVYGFGMDYRGYWRNAPGVFVASE
ncbi:hypoxanthine-guanine phosphoribosyltransferase [Marinimicrobium sp. C2-29]|uniref:hypoxanthine-guanine phosphoribosyltransferase n=1 Tax=Marinimicrobium sp. C2-29 TaxID=3139825 RepID=UPI003139E419